MHSEVYNFLITQYIERDIDTETGMKSEKGRESGEIETDTEKGNK